MPASAAQAALNHHQRFDGSGYPARVDHATGESLPPLAGKQIPVFSRIAILADIYDAATTMRCYSAAKPPVQVLHEMRTFCRRFFDPAVEAAFYRTVPAFPIGQVVTLSDGVEAAVIDFNADFPLRPKVQCLRSADGQRLAHSGLEEIDLALYSELSIVAVNGRDVPAVRPTTGQRRDAGAGVGGLRQPPPGRSPGAFPAPGPSSKHPAAPGGRPARAPEGPIVAPGSAPRRSLMPLGVI